MKFHISKKSIDAQTLVTRTMLKPNNLYFGFHDQVSFPPKAAPKNPDRHAGHPYHAWSRFFHTLYLLDITAISGLGKINRKRGGMKKVASHMPTIIETVSKREGFRKVKIEGKKLGEYFSY